MSAAAPSVTPALCKTTIFLVRHGARFDFANREKWAHDCKELGINSEDPPLSALGLEQARTTANALAGEGIEHILVSPYLRVIQTAQPLAHLCKLGISVEEGLAELCHTSGSVTPARQRYQYFPEVDLDYKALQPEASAGNQEDVVDYLRRMLLMAEELPKKFGGRTVACFSHAASIALVAALAGTSLAEAGRFAPCGIFKLVKDEGAAKFTIEKFGADNSGHVAENHPSTFPWCFEDMFAAEEADGLWKEACGLGPANLASSEAEE